MTRKLTERLTANASGIARAVELLRQGGIVAIPTETVYGLAAKADDREAVARVFTAKGRPSHNPLIVHVAEFEDAAAVVHCDERASQLAAQFWPGPLTLVLPRRSDVALADAIHTGLPTVAVRAPDHPVMRAVLKQLGHPLAAPSANRSETVSPTSADHVLATLDGRIDAVIDGGTTQNGLESTIVALRDGNAWSVLRPGPVTDAMLESVLGPGRVDANPSTIEAPGQLAKHYSPGKPVRLNAEDRGADEFLIGFGDMACDCNLSANRDLNEAAARLYACLHNAANAPEPRIAVAPVPDEGVGCAINDRLRRAAALSDQLSGS